MTQIVQAYFAAFNAGDVDGMIGCLTDDIAHHVNEGQVRIGKDAFRTFCNHMNHCYQETLTDLVCFQTGDRAAAEYTVNGRYLKTDDVLPQASGQTYVLPAGSFFTLQDDKIARVTTYYNLADWVRQVS
ncbi:MAG: ketosteroid isomerase-related protein [Pseudomonadota bacterium]